VADADDVRRLALALEGVEEIESDGFDFRVDGRGFVWSYPERVPGRRRVIRTDIGVLYVGDEAEKQALLLGDPDLFFTTHCLHVRCSCWVGKKRGRSPQHRSQVRRMQEMQSPPPSAENSRSQMWQRKATTSALEGIATGYCG